MNDNGQRCWKESLHILSERMKLASILTTERMQDTVVGLQTCFSGPNRMNKVDGMQTAGNSL